MKKIAIIGLKGLPAFGGAALVGENIIEQLKNKYDFTVYSISSHTDLSTGSLTGYRQIVFKSIPLKKLNTFYYYILSLLHVLIVGDYNIIHVHHRDASCILPLLRLRYKTVLTTHGMVLTEKWKRFNLFFKLQDFLFLRFTNYITCVSKKDLNYVSRFKKNNIVHIPNGITIDNFQRPIERSKDTLMFAAGRIVPSKGCHILLEALKLINYGGKIKIAGDHLQMNAYHRKIYELARDLDVDFMGLIKNKSLLYQTISEALLFVYPSRIESMSMMLLEVAGLKTPIICSNIPENKDIFDESEVLFFKTDDVKDLAEKISWALLHESEMMIKAEMAYQKLLGNYNWNSIALKYSAIYERILNNKSGL